MYYYLYKITNLKTKEYYLGVHKTQDINDGYMGSGKRIIESIKQYGINSFKKEILEKFNDSKSMYKREKEFITENVLSDIKCLNLTKGGYGGFDYINQNNIIKFKGKKHSKATKKLIGEKSKGRKHTEETKKKISKSQKGIKIAWNKGIKIGKHSEEHKRKISESVKKYYAGLV